MNLTFTQQTWEDYQFWQNTDKKTLRGIHLLIQDIQRSPQEGIGKQEPLKHHLKRLLVTAHHR